ECPALYRRYSKEHTFCKTKNQKCNIKRWGVSQDDRNTIINLHNKVRNNIALGQDQSGRLPAAGDMLEMEWDDELAQIAQKLADQCVFKHDCDDCRKVENFDVGQNIFTRGITAVEIPDPFKSWTQLYVCNYGPAGNLDDSELYKVDKPCEKCPSNTCCGSHCKKHNKSTSYLGLCDVLNGSGPDFDETDFSNYIFNCDFKPESDCNNKVEGS
nr:RecName: Full=Venom allergen 5; AltName: Full=Antigen 5; AltName: Full=Cysteine-rich venom protein; Short=CRVP [Tityus serrulatus]